MPPYPNLISDSLLIGETIQLLQSFGGRASAVKVVDYVMKISKPEPNLAKLLAADLVSQDPRLFLNDDVLELVPSNQEQRKLAETDFVVFDLETTGAKSPPCRVTEIGAYRIRKNQIVEEFQTLVNPDAPIPLFISQLTGITNAMVKNAPRFCEIADEFLNFIGDSILVAHNAHFDLRFLNFEIGRIHKDYRVGNSHLCTVKMSRKLLPHIENHRLNTVAGYYRVSLINHHRAADDARATAHIFLKLLGEARNLGINDLAGAKKLKF